MNKILLNILMFVGSQQFILGAEVNKEIKPKLGVCLYCYIILPCEHEIYNTYKEGDLKNCTECVKEVYSVCSKGHTLCENCICSFVENGVNNKQGTVNCIFYGKEVKLGEKKFDPCFEQIDREIVEHVLNFIGDKNAKEKLEKYDNLQKQIEYERVLLHPENKACKYEGCRGFFDVTKNFFCNNDGNHIHCKLCFEKEHKGKCKDPLSKYKDPIEFNKNIQKKIKERTLQYGDIEGYKPCPNCHRIIAKSGGCNHMTCGCDYNENAWEKEGCGYQWCWRCGKACFCGPDNKKQPGYDHYNYYNDDKNNSCKGKQGVNTDPDNPNYFDDGDYFGIKNGNFKKQFKKLAREGVIDVEVETPEKIKKVNWDKINKEKKDWMTNNPGKKYYNECCTECCCYVFTFFQ